MYYFAVGGDRAHRGLPVQPLGGGQQGAAGKEEKGHPGQEGEKKLLNVLQWDILYYNLCLAKYAVFACAQNAPFWA